MWISLDSFVIWCPITIKSVTIEKIATYFLLVYSLSWIYSDWMYPYVLDECTYELRPMALFSSLEPEGTMILTGCSFRNSPCTLGIALLTACCLVGSMHWWCCRLLNRGFTATLGALHGWTVNWRLRGLAAVLNTSFASCWCLQCFRCYIWRCR